MCSANWGFEQGRSKYKKRGHCSVEGMGGVASLLYCVLGRGEGK